MNPSPKLHSRKNSTKSKNTWILTFILLAIVLPLVISFVYLRFYQSGTDLGHRNNGTLFVQTLTLTEAGIDGVAQDAAEPKWILLQIVDEECDNACLDRARLVGNIVTGMGKRSQRIRPVVLLADEAKDQFFSEFNPLQARTSQSAAAEGVVWHYPIEILELSAPELAEIQSKVSAALRDEPVAIEGIKLYFIDPLGRFVLGFPTEITAKQIIRDMEILLKVSLIG